MDVIWLYYDDKQLGNKAGFARELSGGQADDFEEKTASLSLQASLRPCIADVLACVAPEKEK